MSDQYSPEEIKKIEEEAAKVAQERAQVKEQGLDPQTQFTNYMNMVISKLPGFSSPSGKARVKNHKQATLALAKEIVRLRMECTDLRQKVEALMETAQLQREAITTLARNEVLIQTITANVMFESMGRGDEWENAWNTFLSIETVEETTQGAVEIRRTADDRILIKAQVKDAEGDEIVWRRVPTQFLDGIQWHAIQTYMRKQDVKLHRGSSLYLTFPGSADFVDLIPEDYVDVEERLDAAAKETEAAAKEMEERGGVATVSSTITDADGELKTMANEMFPGGVDDDGDPIDPALLEGVKSVGLNGLGEQGEAVANIASGEGMKDDGKEET